MIDESNNQDLGLEDEMYWVGIGASAGGLEAIRDFVGSLPYNDDKNVTYIFAQHLSPKRDSMLVELISRETKMEIQELVDGTDPEPNIMYITPPDSDVYIENKRIHLRQPKSEFGPKPSVDFFFNSLANELQTKAIGVILSGTGSDGAHGVRAIKAAGGITLAQDPKSCKYDGMPNSSIDTSCIDLVLPANKLGPEILNIISAPNEFKILKEEEVERTTIQELLFLLKEKTKVCFKDYKAGTLYRRINRRMQASNTQNLEEYLEFVKQNPEELDNLFKDIMITVTNFFRDPQAFDSLKGYVNEIISSKESDENIRIWIPGCATGEEVYSVAILFAEAAGGVAQLDHKFNFQIFATDIDTEALSIARKGIYPEATMENVSKEIRDKYFRHKSNNFEVIKPLRDSIVFSRHNIFEDPPFLRLDLISCRNLLIYFNTKLQQDVMNLFHYAMSENCILFLGKSESLGDSAHLYNILDKKNKIFKRRLITNAPYNKYTHKSFTRASKIENNSKRKNEKATHDLPDAYIEALAPDSLLIDEEMEVIRIYGNLQPFTQLSAGGASMNLMTLARKEFRQELRALIYKLLRENADSSVLPKRLMIDGEIHVVNISVKLLHFKNSSEKLLLVNFAKEKQVEKIELKNAEEEAHPLVAELEQELSSTKEHLQTVVEELETSNEELQSTNEELQSSNEELQSSNEELETANEELQSTNEELITVNEELQAKTSELTSMNEDLNNIKESIDFPMLVVDKSLRITRYNKAANKIFMLHDRNEGEAITAVASLIELPDLRNNITEVIKSGKLFSRQIKNENNSFLERILPYKDCNYKIDGAILTYVDNTKEQEALNQLAKSEERFNLAVKGSGAGIWDWDIESGYMYWSPFLLSMLGISDSDYSGSFDELKKRMHNEDRPDVMDILDAHLKRSFDFTVEFRMRKLNGQFIWVHMRGQAVWDKNKRPLRMAGSIYDVTDRKIAFSKLTESNASLERFAYICSHDLKEPARIVNEYAKFFADSYKTSLDGEAKKYLGYITNSSQYLQDMISGILNYSQLKNKSLTLVEIELEEEVKKIQENLKLSIEEKCAELIYSKLPMIYADKIQIFQVIQNLLSNAIKFCQSNPKITIGECSTDEEWVIFVKDNGIGIDEKNHNKIFEVFKKLNRQTDYPGTGIGLSVCKEIIEKHGGRLWVESKLNIGSTFYFSLPRRQQQNQSDNQVEAELNLV